MSKWLISIVGVAFLGVLLDIIYPNGKTNAFCKSMFGVIVVFVMISPLLNFKDKSFKLDLMNNEIIENFNNSKINVIKDQIDIKLKGKGIEGTCVEIYGNMIDNEFVIDNIYVDCSQVVLSENEMNINKYEVISECILEITKIDSERIIIYG